MMKLCSLLAASVLPFANAYEIYEVTPDTDSEYVSVQFGDPSPPGFNLHYQIANFGEETVTFPRSPMECYEDCLNAENCCGYVIDEDGRCYQKYSPSAGTCKLEMSIFSIADFEDENPEGNVFGAGLIESRTIGGEQCEGANIRAVLDSTELCTGEGEVCFESGVLTAYCSLDVGAATCAYCDSGSHEIPTAPENFINDDNEWQLHSHADWGLSMVLDSAKFGFTEEDDSLSITIDGECKDGNCDAVWAFEFGYDIDFTILLFNDDVGNDFIFPECGENLEKSVDASFFVRAIPELLERPVEMTEEHGNGFPITFEFSNNYEANTFAVTMITPAHPRGVECQYEGTVKTDERLRMWMAPDRSEETLKVSSIVVKK